MIHVEDLEYKMSNMQPAEEQLITGNSMAGWQIGSNPSVGDTLTFGIVDANNIPAITYTVSQADLNPMQNIVNPSEASPTFSIAMNAAALINQRAQQYGYSAVAAMSADLFNPQYMPPYFSEVILTANGTSTATISGSSTGTTNFLVAQEMTACPVTATLVNTTSNTQTTYYGYVALLDALQMYPAQANLSLWLTKADVANFRQDEVSARRRVYEYYCEELSKNLGGQEYIDHFFGGGGGVVA